MRRAGLVCAFIVIVAAPQSIRAESSDYSTLAEALEYVEPWGEFLASEAGAALEEKAPRFFTRPPLLEQEPMFPNGYVQSVDIAGGPLGPEGFAGICEVLDEGTGHACIVCSNETVYDVRVRIGSYQSGDTDELRVCAAWPSGDTWYRVGWADLVDSITMEPITCFQYWGGDGDEWIAVSREAEILPNPNDVCRFSDFTDQFTEILGISGGDGYDLISGSQYRDNALRAEFVAGQDGDDEIYIVYTDWGMYARIALGMRGDDNIYGSSITDDYIWGGYGDDEIWGGEGNDKLNGGINIWECELFGDCHDYGIDTIRGQEHNDLIIGGDGDMLPFGYDDFLYGGAGQDEIWGDFYFNPPADIAYGDDYIEGGGGADLLHGGSGADYLFGGPGDDLLYGDDGIDDLWGGGTADYDVCDGGPPPGSSWFDDPDICHDDCEETWYCSGG